ncbi:hypothetical protein MFMK1_001939 [Metallumcola ferriviriculae]|uniref:Uncharacterized protein n=1 Tax=Metallumcola ferriviriculae TaxID=3039180 RepID=A0AAU0UPJ8_9FIRM|nr:hypothetical protein MFMK1_001939 [Desulfitibacteraceae bacterium MK1]
MPAFPIQIAHHGWHLSNWEQENFAGHLVALKMQIIIDAKKLKESMTLVGKVVDGKGTMPILSSFLVKTDESKDSVTLFATNLDDSVASKTFSATLSL